MRCNSSSIPLKQNQAISQVYPRYHQRVQCSQHQTLIVSATSHMPNHWSSHSRTLPLQFRAETATQFDRVRWVIQTLTWVSNNLVLVYRSNNSPRRITEAFQVTMELQSSRKSMSRHRMICIRRQLWSREMPCRAKICGWGALRRNNTWRNLNLFT